LGLLLLAAGKLVYDIWDKDFRVATNTLLIFFAAFAVMFVAVLSDLIVNLSRPRDAVQPATVSEFGDR
jgi:hypothetical protein